MTSLSLLESHLTMPLTFDHALELLQDLTGQVPVTQGRTYQQDKATQAAVAAVALATAPQVTGTRHDAGAGPTPAALLVDWACRWAQGSSPAGNRRSAARMLEADLQVSYGGGSFPMPTLPCSLQCMPHCTAMMTTIALLSQH